MKGGIGLTQVPDDELELLFRRAHQGLLSYPLRRSELLLLGAPRLAEHGDALLGLDEKGVRAVLVAVLAERRHARKPSAR